jgi:hypothetical protein
LPSKSIIQFHSGNLENASRTLEEIWKFNDDELEGYHTYIQWLFPLIEPSAINFAAPVLDTDVISEFKKSSAVQNQLLISFNLMLKFYGFEINESDNDIMISKRDDYEVKKE